MTKQQEKKIDAYVDARRSYKALCLAEKMEGKTEERTRLIKAARVMVSERARPLTGGMLGTATRLLTGYVQHSEGQMPGQALKVAILAGIMLLSAGCASYTWDLNGSSLQTFKRDAYECERDADAQWAAEGRDIGSTLRRNEMLRRCLESKGYTRNYKS